MKRIFWLLQAGLFYVLTWLVSLVPDRMTRSVGTGIGLTLRLLLPSRRRVSEANIRSCQAYMRQQPNWGGGDQSPDELTRAVFTNIGRSLIEVSRLYHNRGSQIFERIEIKGIEQYNAAKANNTGILFLTGHFGNWELSPLYYAYHLKTPVTAVARKQDNPYLNKIVETIRMRYDNRIIYKDNAIKNIISTLKKGGTIGILVDQAVMPNEGCVVDFLGRKAWASKAPVLIARKTGATVLPGYIYRDGDRHVIQFLPALNFSNDQSDAAVANDVQAYSNILERFVIEHPESWYWIHKRWKRTEGL